MDLKSTILPNFLQNSSIYSKKCISKLQYIMSSKVPARRPNIMDGIESKVKRINFFNSKHLFRSTNKSQ